MTTPTVIAPSSREISATVGAPPGPGAPAFAGGHEDHVGALERLLQLVPALVRGGLPDLGVRACAEAARAIGSDLELDVGVRHQERLGVRVDGDELAPGQPRVDHAVDGVRAAAADAGDLQDCEELLGRIAHAHRVKTSTCSGA